MKVNLWVCEFGQRTLNNPKRKTGMELYFRIMVPSTTLYLDIALGWRYK